MHSSIFCLLNKKLKSLVEVAESIHFVVKYEALNFDI